MLMTLRQRSCGVGNRNGTFYSSATSQWSGRREAGATTQRDEGWVRAARHPVLGSDEWWGSDVVDGGVQVVLGRQESGDGAAGALAAEAVREAWVARAACTGVDPERLFVRGAAQREATAICRHCPVQMECLADALDNRVPFGVWGGLTERERRALLRTRPDVTSWSEHLEAVRASRARDSRAS